MVCCVASDSFVLWSRGYPRVPRSPSLERANRLPVRSKRTVANLTTMLKSCEVRAPALARVAYQYGSCSTCSALLTRVHGSCSARHPCLSMAPNRTNTPRCGEHCAVNP